MLLRELAIIADNSVKDVLDERLLSLCVILSLAAIIAPLLILFGLKQGVVDTIRNQFINDPIFRQITPKSSVALSDLFFQSIEDDSRTEAVIRNFTLSAAMIQLNLPGGRKSRNIEIHSTTLTDPLLKENGGVYPDQNEVTITSALAKKYNLQPGSKVTLLIGRQLNGQRQTAKAVANVVSVLSPRASKNEGIFAPVELVSDIEKFRFGQSVDRSDWPHGISPRPTPMIDGLLVSCKTLLDDNYKQRLLTRTDFSIAREPMPEEMPLLLTTTEGTTVRWSIFRSVGGATTSESVSKVRSELRGSGCQFTKWVRPVEVDVDSQIFQMNGLSLASNFANLFQLDVANDKDRSFSNLAKAIVSESSALETGQTVSLSYSGGKKKLVFPTKVVAKLAELEAHQIIVPTPLLEQLRGTDQAVAKYDDVAGELKLTRLGYSGFRIYARAIDDLPALAEKVSTMAKVDVFARTDDIVRVQILDRGLSKIVTIIMIVGLLGGSGALIASLTSSVERKLTLMSTYQLIGFRRVSVSVFPVIQGVIFAFGGMFIAILFYFAFSGVVNRSLNNIILDVSVTTNIDYVQLGPFQLLMFTIFTVLLSIVCSLVAVRRTLESDPASALRLE